MRFAKLVFILALIACVYGLGYVQQHLTSPEKTRETTPTTANATSTQELSRVIRVIDGDTIVVDFEGVTTTVRLLGVDTPETVHPEKPVQCFGPEASAKTKELLEGQSVRLEEDPTQGHLDKYGRTLAYVFLPDGTLIDEILISQGYGKEYTYHTAYKYQTLFKKDESLARANQLGLWSPSTCSGDTQKGAAVR